MDAEFIKDKTLYTLHTGLPVFLTETKITFFNTTENRTARVKIYQANFILFGVISLQT